MIQAREFLKNATAPEHQLLDDSPLVRQLADGTITIDSYRHLLEEYLAFFQSWETHAETAYPEWVRDLGSFRFCRTSWLEEDLDQLGSTKVLIGSKFYQPSKLNHAQFAGVMYVVEGSSLGGMHLSRKLGHLPGENHRFFTGYGSDTMPNWASFVTWLNKTVTRQEDMELAAGTAVETFRWFRNRFDQLATKLKDSSEPHE